MSNYVEKPVHFSADCVLTGGLCAIDRQNIVFLDERKEPAAIDLLQRKCATEAIIPQFLERRSYPRACALPAAPMRNEQQ